MFWYRRIGNGGCIWQKEGVCEMKPSKKCAALVAKYEGCKLKAYKCPAGVWTIGYGHTENVKPGDVLPSEKEARKLLLKDLGKYAGYVNRLIEDKSIRFTVNQNMFDALTSFVYNCGPANLKTLVNQRDAKTVGKKILLYDKCNGKVLEGLSRRRKEESRLFLSE